MPRPLLLSMTGLGLLLGLMPSRPTWAALRTVNVSNNTQLSAALAGALPGDEIILADGNYSGFTMTRSGVGPDSNNMILIRAQNQNGAVINSGVVHFKNTAYVTVEGLKVATAGALRSFDDVNWNVAVLFDGADHSRLTRSTLALQGQPDNTYWVMLARDSNHNRIDHNEIGPDPGRGIYIWTRGNPNIPGVNVNPAQDRGPWAHGAGAFNPNMARNTLIDHNYIHNHTDRESIILGGIGMTGDYQDTGTVVEHNLFENNAGDSELISIKTSGSIIRYNTVREGYGAIVNRAGNGSRIYGNMILADGRDGSLGIRLHEMDHQVYNNYIENTDGFGIQVYEGDLYDESDGVNFTHAQVVNAQITHNTIVNPGGPAIQLGAGGNVLPAKDIVVANNLLKKDSGTLFTENLSNPTINPVYSQNIIWPQNPNKEGFIVVNPQLTTVGELQKLAATSPAINAANPLYYPEVTLDMEKQSRDALRDIGADEFGNGKAVLRPLTPADVGPLSGGGIAVFTGVHEAENAMLSGATTASNTIGYTGSGFVDYTNSSGDFVEWTVHVETGGLYDVGLRYSLLSGNRPLRLEVNGQVVDAALNFPSTGDWEEWDYVAPPLLELQAGANSIRATAIGAYGPKVDHLTVNPLEAETVDIAGGSMSDEYGGFSGIGFVNFHEAGDFVEWTFELAEAGSFDLNFRYALQPSRLGNRQPLQVEVNGEVVAPSMIFQSTGAWSDWDFATLSAMSFHAGANTVRITAVGTSNPHIDHLLLSPGGQFGDLDNDGDLDIADWQTYILWSHVDMSGLSLDETYLRGDFNGDGFNNLDDMRLFIDAYNVANGVGAFERMIAGVPEPGSAGSLLIIAPLLMGRYCRAVALGLD